MTLLYNDVMTWATAYLAPSYPTPAMPPPIMPQYSEVFAKKSPQEVVFLSLGDGPGLNTEQLFDAVTLTVRVVGRQNSYDSAESLALLLDTGLLQLGAASGSINGVPLLSIARSGGRPTPISYDTADRTEFQCSYVVTAATSLYAVD